FPHRLARELDPVRAVHEAITDHVGHGLVADDGMPVFGVKLTGDDRGSDAIPIIQHLEEDFALGRAEGLESEIVEHEDVYLGEAAEGGEIRAVRARLRELVEEPGDAPVRDRVAVATRLVSERAGEITLPEARGPGEDDGLVRGDPARGAEVGEERLGEPARMAG